MGYNCLISILILTCSLLIPIAFPIDDTELGYKCLPNTKDFTSDYNQSRALVVIDLISNIASSDGFKNASYTWPLQSPNEPAYGLALCRGDVSPEDCKACVNNAAQTLINADHCINNRSAIIWRDFCSFKYSDVDFLGTMDTDNKLTMRGGDTWMVSDQQAAYMLLKNLTLTAIGIPNKLFAHGEDQWDGVTTYGMAQCTRDISPGNCNKCLNSAVRSLFACCGDYSSARVVFGSCNVRYEIYNFLNFGM